MIIIETSKGDIHLELDFENTPKTAENFLNYVREGFYDNTIFHRVISGFMIQGGGMDEDLNSKETNEPIENEAASALPNQRGSIAMARTSDPHSASSQFFINLADNEFLNFKSESMNGYGYCVFGQVAEGMDVVDAIASVSTGHKLGHGDVPEETIFIRSIKEKA